MKRAVVRGIVIHGDKLGKKLGYPTANLNWPKKRRLTKGIFIATVQVLDKKYQGIVIIGIPSLTDGKPKLEIHIFDFEGIIYGKWLSATLIEKIRDLKTYKSKKELLKAIQKDCQKARTILKK
ncbi:riboflavin kinase [Patescibacteria group bacterium]|nr:riboflavin kinase [Patescibacteria group bacterium]